MASVDRASLLRAGAAAAGAVAVAAAAGTRRGRAVDASLFARANLGAGRRADRFFGGITELGSYWASLGAATTLGALGRRRTALRTLGAASAAWLAGQGLKKLYRRARPYDALPELRLLIARPRGTSWPSSHPMVVTAFLTVAGRELRLSGPARAATAGVAGGVAASRVYLGVHYPSDVAGGLLLGWALGQAWNALVARGAASGGGGGSG